MHLEARHPYALQQNLNSPAFPAPLCEACNVAMALNGEYPCGVEGIYAVAAPTA